MCESVLIFCYVYYRLYCSVLIKTNHDKDTAKVTVFKYIRILKCLNSIYMSCDIDYAIQLVTHSSVLLDSTTVVFKE